MSATLGSVISGQSAIAMGDYQAQTAELQAEAMERKAGDVKRQKEFMERKVQRDVAQMLSAQRAGYAAQGVQVGSGSAAATQARTRRLGQEDLMMIRENAWRAAWGIQSEAESLRHVAQYTRLAARTGAQLQFASGVLSDAEAFIRYKGSK